MHYKLSAKKWMKSVTDITKRTLSPREVQWVVPKTATKPKTDTIYQIPTPEPLKSCNDKDKVADECARAGLGLGRGTWEDKRE